VLAFGKLSVLEICAVSGSSLTELESPLERVCVFKMQPSLSSSLPRLGGIHKFAPLTTQVRADGTGVDRFADYIADRTDAISNFSLSAYGLDGDAYDGLLQQLLDAFRSRGFKKIHLIRPEELELRADQVLARGSLDAVTFPYHGEFFLGLTTYVPDSVRLRERGVKKPIPRADISLSPRLAKVLVNLSGVVPGQTLLDPFCGSGTILAEGLLKSARCIGVDFRKRQIEEARMNLRWVSKGARGSSFRLQVGNATDLAGAFRGKKVDGVATEPILLPRLEARPNFDLAKEMIDNSGEVYAEALASIADVVKPGGRIVVVVPVVRATDESEVSVGLDGRPLGLSLFQPGPILFQYPVRLSFESTRWIRRAVYVFEVRP